LASLITYGFPSIELIMDRTRRLRRATEAITRLEEVDMPRSRAAAG
jgi:hypothetical protein